MKKTSNKLLFGSLKIMACAAILAAMSIVLGKYLAFNLTDTIRISFENLPILIAGIFFGPFVGAAVGVVADLLGCFMVGYAINPIITLGAGMIGFTCGLVSMALKKHRLPRVLLSVSAAHLVGSVTIKTIGLVIFYSVPPLETALWRLLTYTMIGAAECILLYLLVKNPAFERQIENMKPKSISKKDRQQQ